MKVYNLLSRNINRSISEILSSTSLGFGKSKTTELLKKLEEKGIVAVEGKGRGTKYSTISILQKHNRGNRNL